MNDFRTIHFKIGEESRPIVENASHFQDSIVKEQYITAFTEINSYLNRIKQGDQTSPQEQSQVSRENEYLNNLFAFVGERGAGKTSCMTSVANMLITKGSNSPSFFTPYEAIRQHSFQTISLIDPSYFDHTHNIIAIIVAKLFKNFNDAHDDAITRNFEQRRKLIELFSKTQQQMQCLLEPARDDIQDDLNNLVNLSASVDLKETLRQLINEYLRYFATPDKDDQLLLLMVDDVDLNTSEATTMAEQIRKYLILPNVIILMSIKLSQLERLKWQELASAYQKLLDQKQMMPATISEMVERYLTKLIPYGHRIFMPDFEAYCNAQLTIEGIDNQTETFASVRQAVPELIFRKTRYLFYNSEFHTSYIIPRNLRELRALINMLYRMEDYTKIEATNGESNEQRKTAIERLQAYNKTQFRKYVFDTWLLDNLTHDDREQIDDLLHIDDAGLINARVLAILRQRFDLEKLNENKEDALKDLDYLLHINNVSYNIAIGDILSLITHLEKRFAEQKHQKFFFLLRTYYSMQLREYFAEKIALLKDDKATAPKELVTKNNMSELTNFDKLVAGRFTNSRLEEFLPRERRMPSRSNRQINVRHLNKLVEKAVNDWDKASSEEIQLIEFFMLCTSRPFSTQHKDKNATDFYDPDFRKNSSPQYAENLINAHNAFFDLNAFFYNITRIKECYQRFLKGDAFYQIANDPQKGSKSLWHQFKVATLKRQYPHDEQKQTDIGRFSMEYWLNWCSLRHCEIIQNMNDLLIGSKPSYRGSDRHILSLFFEQTAHFSIPTYDYIQQNKEYGHISLTFCELIVNVLRIGQFRQKPTPSQMRIAMNAFATFQRIYTMIFDDKDDAIDIEEFSKKFKIKPINLQDTVTKKFIEEVSDSFPVAISTRIIRNRMSKTNAKLSRSEIRDIADDINKQLQSLR